MARELADRGIAAFVLKYRLIPTPKSQADAEAFMQRMMSQAASRPKSGSEDLAQMKAPEDVRAAFAMVRSNAAKWGVDPQRVGMIGFSAGAMLARGVGLDADAAKRPAFIGYVYGSQDAMTVPADAPPLFNAIALDDPLFLSQGFPIVQSWLAAKRPVEVHGYQKGGHGSGLGIPGTTSTMLLDDFTAWLSTQGFLTKKTTRQKRKGGRLSKRCSSPLTAGRTTARQGGHGDRWLGQPRGPSSVQLRCWRRPVTNPAWRPFILNLDGLWSPNDHSRASARPSEGP